MNENIKKYNAILSVLVLGCFVVGWFDLLSPEMNELIYRRILYVLIGVSFIFQSRSLKNKSFLYPLYICAALRIVGAFLPLESRFSAIKTIGLFAGVMISLFNRQR